MALLIITTILWAFSFSLFGEYLAGHVDSYFAVLVRVGLAALVFLPFLRTRGHSVKTIALYMLVGAMQLGIMYMLSFHAYLYLTVSELLLFTVLTPLYITLIYDLMSGRRLRWSYAFSALLAVIGAGIIRYDQVTLCRGGVYSLQSGDQPLLDRPAAGAVVQYQLCHWHGGLQASDGNAANAAAQRLCLVLHGGLYGGGRGLVHAGKCAENACNHATVGNSGLSWRGSVRHWLLYVELRRDPGGCGDAGHHEQYACAGRAAG